MTIAFDTRGVAVALAFFLGLLLVLLILLLFNLREERLGPLRLSRSVRVAGFTALALVYLATLYYWLFWRTFYELRTSPRAERVELTVLMPKRGIELAADEIIAIRAVPGSRAGFARLVVETRDGRRYRSPDRAKPEIEQLHARLPEIGSGRAVAPGTLD